MPLAQAVATGSSRLAMFLERADELAIFPPVALRIVAIGQNENTTLRDLEEVVQQDPSISSRILKIANSPFYGLNRQVSSLQHAMFILGFYPARDMALGLALASSGRRRDGRAHRAIFEHSIQTAIVARILSRHLRRVNANEAFLAALLHDLGRILMLSVAEDSYPAIVAAFPEPTPRLLAAETMAYGFTHAELGASCLARWELPETITGSIRRHHDDVDQLQGDHPIHRMALVLAFADFLQCEVSAGTDFETLTAAIREHPAAQAIRVSPRQASDIAAEVMAMEFKL